MTQLIRKHKLVPFIVALALFALSICSFWGYRTVAGTLLGQNIAPVFRGEAEELFSQVSVFFPVGQGVTEDNFRTFHDSLENEYVAASVTAPENGSLYRDGWAYEGSVSVAGEKSSVTVKAIGVGGDFFYFHPLYLRAGSYISGDDFARDTVVIDRELAWRLFGSVDVTGMPLTIGGQPFVVSGVVLRDTDIFSTTAYEENYGEETAGLFMNGQTLAGLTDTRIIEYDIVGASPIDNFLKNIAAKGFSGAVVVENTGRFSAFRLWEVLKSFGRRSMRTDNVVYPYWENAARFAEDTAVVLLLIAAAAIIYPVIWLVMTAVRLVKLGVRAGVEAVPRLLDRISEWRWARKEKRKGRNK